MAYLNSSVETAQHLNTDGIASSPPFFEVLSDDLGNELLSADLEDLQNDLWGFDSDEVASTPSSLYSQTAAQFPWLVPAWIFGVFLASIRPLAGLYNVHRLKTIGQSELPESITLIGDRAANRIGINRAIRFVQSTLVQVPTVIGLFKPVVLLPASVATGLSPPTDRANPRARIGSHSATRLSR